MADDPQSRPEMSPAEWEEMIRQRREAATAPEMQAIFDDVPRQDPWREAMVRKDAVCDAAKVLRIALKAAAEVYGPMQPLYQRLAPLPTPEMLIELARSIYPEAVQFMTGDVEPER